MAVIDYRKINGAQTGHSATFVCTDHQSGTTRIIIIIIIIIIIL